MNRALALVLVAAVGAGCKRTVAATPEEAHRALVAAAVEGDAVEVYRQLDRKTQWSIISMFKAEHRMRELVTKHYPPTRRARELERTALAARAGNEVAYFVALAAREKLLEQLAGARKIDSRQGAGDRVVLRCGAQQLAFCRDEGWRYCGWRERAEALKVRVSRDLEIVKENAEIFRKGR